MTGTRAYLYGLTHRPRPTRAEPPRYQPDLSATYTPCSCRPGVHLAWQRRDILGFAVHLREVWS